MTASQRRAQLIEIGARIIDTEGFHAATIERIAGECGVTRTVLYQHFGGLDGLFDAVVERATQRAGQAFAHAVTAHDDTRPAEVIRRILDAADADPPTWRLFLVIPPAGPPALVEALAQGRAAIRRYTTAGLIARTQGDMSDPELAARFLQAVADEAVRLRLADPTVFTTERLVNQYAVIINALIGLDQRASAPQRPWSTQ